MKVILQSLLVVVIYIEGVLSVTCPLGSTEQDGYCFIAGKQTAKYQNAQMLCLGYGCKMVVPSAAKRTAIQAFGLSNSLVQVMFPILDELEEGQFIEAPTGELFTDLVWASGRPSVNRNNNCVRINSLSTWEMIDIGCESKSAYICECDPE